MRFEKLHGAGNDFVMLDGRDTGERDWSSLARATCDRHFGVGADGLILLLPGSGGADLRMRMWNPDGSEAEMCGNGIRCLVRFAARHGLVASDAAEVSVDTLAGRLTCGVAHRDGDGLPDQVRVDMGRPRLEPDEIPVRAPAPGPVRHFDLEVDGARYDVACVSMGNPHAVLFVDEDPTGFPLDQVGPRIEHHPAFPQRTNFHVVRVLAAGRAVARHWERGAGLTLACGTGASAIGVAGRLRGLLSGDVLMDVPGGQLRIQWDGDGQVFMTGPAADVFAGEWPNRPSR